MLDPWSRVTISSALTDVGTPRADQGVMDSVRGSFKEGEGEPTNTAPKFWWVKEPSSKRAGDPHCVNAPAAASSS